MLVYFDPATAPLKGVPQRLLPKAVQQFGEAAESYGLKPVATPGLPNDAIRVNTRGVKDAASLQQWLELVNAVVVDVEASDIPALAGHKVTPESLALYRHLPHAEFSQIAVEDLGDKMRDSWFMGWTGAEPDDSEIGRIQADGIAEEMRKAGLDVPEDRTHKLEESLEKSSDVSPEFLQQFTETNPFQMAESEFGA